jgi:hypothetical protein
VVGIYWYGTLADENPGQIGVEVNRKEQREEASDWYRFAGSGPSGHRRPCNLDMPILQLIHDRSNITPCFFDILASDRINNAF